MKDVDRAGRPLPPLPRAFRVAEMFTSIQGESSHAGLPCTFVRLTGCGLRCAWCDTAYAFHGGEDVAATAIVERVRAAGVPFACLTGGEPLEQPGAGALCRSILDALPGMRVTVETGGHRDISILPPDAIAILDVKCPGSGMERRNDPANLARLRPGDEVKFVLADERDYAFAREFLADAPIPPGVGVLVSPVHGRLDPRHLAARMTRACVAARLNLQTHKYVWGADARGV